MNEDKKVVEFKKPDKQMLNALSDTPQYEPAWCTVGPAMVNVVADVIGQMEQQGWEVKFVSFAGMVVPQSQLTLSKPQPLPAYSVIAKRMIVKGTKPEFPVIKFAPPPEAGKIVPPAAGKN